jgi:excisionase family DNA binding protein
MRQNLTNGPEPLMGVEDVADFYNVPVRTVYAWRHAGKGPKGIRVGRYVRYRREDVFAWLQRQGPAA